MAGRGKKKILSEADLKMAEEMAYNGCKNNTICTRMGWGHNFIEDRPDIRKKLTQKRAEREQALRTAQTQKALVSKDTAMLCFLGKNELGQSDKRKTELAGTVGTREISKEELAELLKEELVSVEDCIAGNENIWRQGQTERVGDQDEEAQGATGP